MGDQPTNVLPSSFKISSSVALPRRPSMSKMTPSSSLLSPLKSPTVLFLGIDVSSGLPLHLVILIILTWDLVWAGDRSLSGHDLNMLKWLLYRGTSFFSSCGRVGQLK